MSSLISFSLWLFVILVLASLWYAQGIREAALARVKQHCTKLDLVLLDEYVAFQKLDWAYDLYGTKRIIWIYAFEFTVTGEQRYQGSITMFSKNPGRISLEPHLQPITRKASEGSVYTLKPTKEASNHPNGQVVSLADWRKQHPKTKVRPQG
ncbi:uncharacterized protein DUF3301 [Azomonas agilis]|uniref:Uncharacterized protein DUF3301 n=1 Tax=Azomonas agilis TaxID=116849 RepID=A0A562I0T2_9GAMM|nr:DUF3301 domain-containing protein [Azomonas agilis]TWH64278.1 uncharacterized protein DUF3301 [Azomonas agilis]